MTWLQRYQLKRMIRGSLWIMPMLAVAGVFAVAPLIRWLDLATGWTWFNFTPDGASAVLGAFTASMLTFVIFVVSSLLIVVQLASAQLTPRIIASVFTDRRLKWILSIFTFAFTYTIAVSGRLESPTPQLPVMLAIVFNLACIVLFFWFAQWLGASLRPIVLLQMVAEAGRAVVEHVYPNPFDTAELEASNPSPASADAIVISQVARSGVVLAFSQSDLLALAERADSVIHMVPQVGDFVAPGDPLFYVRNIGRPIAASSLQNCVAIGPERTMEQDPRFAFRIMVDIANKALSPAINDPTTAVLALDQIQDLLMKVGLRRLDAGQTLDAKGSLRLCYGTPDWIDFVTLSVTEIRQFGANSMQVVRRLQAMLEHLLRVLPEARRPALQQELALLQSGNQRNFLDEVDRTRARVGDFQGLGSSEQPHSFDLSTDSASSASVPD